MAQYPAAVKTFTTKNAGDVIQPSHIGDLQDEVTAIEDGILNGTAPINSSRITATAAQLGPSTVASLSVTGTVKSHLLFDHNTYDIGASSGTQPRNLYVAQGAGIGGNLTVLSSAVIGGGVTLSGGQIAYPATQNPSADANTLDDYEEGSWTPVIGGSGGTSGQTYSAQAGRYIKIGREVHATGYALLSAKGTITGNVQVQGLPVALENVSNLFVACHVGQMSNLAVAYAWLGGYGSPGTSVIGIVGRTGAAVSSSNLTTTDIGNTTDIVVAIHYRTDN